MLSLFVWVVKLSVQLPLQHYLPTPTSQTNNHLCVLSYSNFYVFQLERQHKTLVLFARILCASILKKNTTWGKTCVFQLFISVVNLSCSNPVLHAEHAVKGGASLLIDSTEMVCCAECHLPCINVTRRGGSVFVCARSQNWFCTLNLKHVQAVCTKHNNAKINWGT